MKNKTLLTISISKASYF